MSDRTAAAADALDRAMLRAHARKIVVAFLERNSIAGDELGGLVSSTLSSLVREAAGAAVAAAEAPAVAPAPITRRPFVKADPSCVVCLEDGLKFRSLRRHLMETHGMSAEQYRAKWGPDAPLVARELSEARSQRARASGFGRGK